MEKNNVCTPGKEMFMEKNSRRRSQHCDSPFYLMPSVSTPPSRFMKIKNPFEPLVNEKLHTHFVSPSIMFAKRQHTTPSEKFRWNIDDISSFKPADIDETSIDQHEQTEDPTLESYVQSKIDMFFNTKEIVPSPFTQPITLQSLIKENDSTDNKPITMKNNSAQTILTLPPVLPLDLEEMLKPYFTYTENQQESESRNNSLYRKLFECNERPDDHRSNSICSSPPPSLSPSRMFLLDDNAIDKRCDFESSINIFEKECTLSPIACRLTKTDSKVRLSLTKSNTANLTKTNLNFTTDMNTSDTSLLQVPTNDHSLPMSTNSSLRLMDDSFNDKNLNTEKVCIDTSAVNWDMEYKNMTLATPSSKDNSSDEMDVSNSNTPRSKIFTGSRKKLSDSFLLDEDEDSDRKESNIKFQDGIRDKATSSKLLLPNDITDNGYHTAGYTMSEDSEWSSVNIFASTPTKNKN